MNTKYTSFRTSSWQLPSTLIAVVLWLSAVVMGMALILRHANTPGAQSETPLHWPMGSRISLASNQPTLIMFAHPRCPCTRASLAELDSLVANCRGYFSAQVWFIKPAGTDNDWTNSSIWHQAAAIPGVAIYCDDNEIESRRFHAETSGHTVLYNQKGVLLFQGGITASRGHLGDNAGLSALEQLLRRTITNQIQTKVFGCPLYSKSRPQGETPCTPPK
ncbi:MAG TPA: hypothetical protein VG938_12665 [Verrucomicrobiae bacterium]|jgi:hypothetical protein|nr:hypothetical protein [Verrucomicrobiae bacterium]